MPRTKHPRRPMAPWPVVARATLLVALACVAPPAAAQGADPPAEGAKTAAPDLPEELTTPRKALRAFLDRMAADKKKKAAQLLDLSELSAEAAASRGPDLAYRLYQVIQRLVPIPREGDSAAVWSPTPDGDDPLSRVPDDADWKGPWSLDNLRYALPDAAVLRLARGADKAWRFDVETVAAIEPLYEKTDAAPKVSVAPVDEKTTETWSVWLRNRFPEGLRRTDLWLPNYQWLCLLGLAVLGRVLDLVTRFVLTQVGDFGLRRYHAADDDEGDSPPLDVGTTTIGVWRPVGRLAHAATWYYGAQLIGFPLAVMNILGVVLKLVTIFAAVAATFAVVDIAARFLAERAKRTAGRFDDMVVPLLSSVTKIVAVIAGLVAVVAAFSVELPYSLLGGLGIGGVAIALASQETLSNFFGSITVLLDRPFEVGDLVVVDGIEGEVEAVGFRSTRLRTGVHSQVTLPNSKLAAASIDNLGRRKYRRLRTTVSLDYDTSPERIDAFCEGIRELIRRHPHTRKDFYVVALNSLEASSLDVLLVVYFEAPDWPTELRERHRLLADILRIARRLDVVFAYPTQTVHLFRGQESPTPREPEDPEREGQRAAALIAGELPNYQDRPGRVKFMGPTPLDTA